MAAKTHVIMGDCREVLKSWGRDSFHACVTDPPYGLQFMGEEWDRLWRDRRDADVEWIAKNRSDTDGLGARLRRAPDLRSTGPEMQEWHKAWAVPLLRVLKPGGHVAAFGGVRSYHRLACALEDAGFEIRDCLMWLYGSGMPKSKNLAGDFDGWGSALKPAWEPIILARKPLSEKTLADNMVRHGAGALNIDRSRIEDDSAVGGRWPSNMILDEMQEAFMAQKSAPRFFYAPKASKEERGEGNTHPTVKPIALMQWLIELLTIPGGSVVDPFMGSGTSALAAVRCARDYVGIEISTDYARIAVERLRTVQEGLPL